MSTVHRMLLTVFARSGHPVAGRQIDGHRRTAGLRAADRQSIQNLQSTGAEVLICTPWAGLYVEGPAAS